VGIFILQSDLIFCHSFKVSGGRKIKMCKQNWGGGNSISAKNGPGYSKSSLWEHVILQVADILKLLSLFEIMK
jgi:hypothetical protein